MGATNKEISMSKPVVSLGNGVMVTDQRINRPQRFVANMHSISIFELSVVAGG